MISLILPYWDRQVAADKALLQLAQTYPDLDMEVIVVDDGNLVPFQTPDVALNIRVIRLPKKTIPKCPTLAWNVGVEYAIGDIVVLSCIEILHTQPVIEKLVESVRNIGPLGYVLAAAWNPETDTWQCHSAVKTPRNPTGTGLSFCGAMHKSLYLKAGGFDDEYRNNGGAGYEDNDFINRMLIAGARFVIRDDLIVIHPKSDATISWGPGRFTINEKLYYKKWPNELRLNSITFCCVNAGDYLGRGREYVEKLYAMLLCCLPDGLAFKFVCFTDDPFEKEGIECRPLIDGIEGWNQKIALFKPGVFEDGERIIYLDLDTLLIGRIDKILDYQGEFAVLRDFWRPEGFGPAVMLWRAGFGDWIWNDYARAGMPELDRGDQEWLETVFSAHGYTPNILQDMYPGFFCSFKGDCKPHPPQGTRVVCFHGLPRPHDCGDWMAEVWNGRVTGSAVELLCNVEMAKIAENIKSACLRDIPMLDQLPANNGDVMLVGGGPSMKDELDFIRAKWKTGTPIIAMNGTADFLADNGIIPDMQIAIDARKENLRFLKRRSAKQYFFASQCHPALFDYIGNPTLFHIALVDWEKYVPQDTRAMVLGGGHSVGMFAMSLAYVLGFRKMHLYGYDSSYANDSHHAYEQKSNDDDAIVEAHVQGRTFKTTAWMVTQVNEFQELSGQLSQMGCMITTHGQGLLPYVAWQRAALAKAA